MTVDFGYYGTPVTNVPKRQDTFAFKMDTNFRFDAFLRGEREYTSAIEPAFYDGGTVKASDPCLEDFSTGFKPGIDSFVLRTDRNIGLVPAGESLNAIFKCDYSYSQSNQGVYVSLAAMNDSLQSGSLDNSNLTRNGVYRLLIKPKGIYFFGKHVFTLEVYLKDQTQITQSTAVLILE